MNACPIIIICGKARSGKDTAAEILSRLLAVRGDNIALADPIKRIAENLFDIPRDLLWGPSEARNQNIEHLSKGDLRNRAQDIIAHARYVCSYMLEQELEGANLNREELLEATSYLYTWLTSVTNKLKDTGSLTCRYILQTLGTEWGRKHIRPDIWVQVGLNACNKLLRGGYNYTHCNGLAPDPEAKARPLAIISDGRFANEILGVRQTGGLAIKLSRNDSGSAAEQAGIAGHQSESELDDIPNHFYNAVVYNNSTVDNLEWRICNVVNSMLMPEYI